MNLHKFNLKEKDLCMIWKIKRDRKVSYLAGTAHFFPYSFKNSLRHYISHVDTVLLEGPLDERAMSMVVEQGSGKGEGSSLYDVLDARTIIQLNKELRHPYRGTSTFISYLEIFKKHSDFLYHQTKGQSPWMAFFNIWHHYLKKRGWEYTMDLDAFKIAKDMGKKVYYLEKIEDQIEALKGIPLERIVNFIKKIEQWGVYIQGYIKHYLRGNLEELMTASGDFPTRCESIIEKREPVLYEKMKTFFEKGNTIVAVGITHIQGIKKMLFEDGYLIQTL